MTKINKYNTINQELVALVMNENNLVANLADAAALLFEMLNHHWIGFYMVDGEQLVLAPFQGPLACTRINYAKGVCGTAWSENITLVVDNVNDFPGHIACSSYSKSEIVVPLRNPNGEVIGVLDIDSDQLSAFDEEDAKGLEMICETINKMIERCTK